MGNELTDKQIDRIMFRYFEDKFKGSVYEEEVAVESMDKWAGFFIDDILLVGHPMGYDSDLWFSNGPIFGHGIEILGLHPSEYHLSMIRYLNKKYPEIKIGKIM